MSQIAHPGPFPQETIAAALFAEATAPAESKASRGIVECLTCRSTFVYRKPDDLERNGRFCSQRCRDGFDACITNKLPAIAYFDCHARRMAMRGPGFVVKCPGCDGEFISAGLRCCSPACERSYRDRQEAKAVAARLGHKARPTRTCEGCGKRIPRYTATGKATRSDVRTCSAKCLRAVRCQKGDFDELSTPETPVNPALSEAAKLTGVQR
jgi:hypothetical protein